MWKFLVQSTKFVCFNWMKARYWRIIATGESGGKQKSTFSFHHKKVERIFLESIFASLRSNALETLHDTFLKNFEPSSKIWAEFIINSGTKLLNWLKFKLFIHPSVQLIQLLSVTAHQGDWSIGNFYIDTHWTFPKQFNQPTEAREPRVFESRKATRNIEKRFKRP